MTHHSKPTFRFIDAADLHLDTPFVGVRRAAPAIGEALREASLDAWDALVDLAVERDAAFLLLAGDIYDGPERGVRAQVRFLRGLRRLEGAGVRVFMVLGNHDALEGWSAVDEWPENVHLFAADRAEAEPVERDGKRLAVVHGVSFARRDTRENLALRFERGDGHGLHVGLLHCQVGSNPEHESYSPCSLDDLLKAGMDYWALGHVHQRQTLREGPWVAYSGSLQGRSPKPGERGAKGALVVDVEAGEVAGVAFEALDRARFLACDVDASDISGLTALVDALNERLEELRAANPDRGLIVRATITGRGEVHRELSRPGALAEVAETLEADAEGRQPFVWWERIIDTTRPAVDRDQVRGRDDFPAEVVRAVDALRADPEKLAALLAETGAPLDARAWRSWIEQLPPDDPAALLEEAEALALDLLAGADEP